MATCNLAAVRTRWASDGIAWAELGEAPIVLRIELDGSLLGDPVGASTSRPSQLLKLASRFGALAIMLYSGVESNRG